MAVGSDPRIGTDLAGYRIEALIGRGGMSVVYRAEHVRLGRKVALKLLTPELAHDERFRERFLRESRIAAAIDHPNIVPIYDADESEDVLYIAMRYVEGEDLKGLLEREGRLEPARALAFLAQVGSALDAAHARGLVHRDVKPGNVLLSGEHCYLADFGLTKLVSSVSGLTATGQLVGTLEYLAPEQISGNPVDRRADLYSLGCLFYECLAGAPPFRRETEAALLWAHVQEEPPPLAARQPKLAAFDPLLARALAKSPEERYQSGAELAAEAEGVLAGRPPARRRLARPRLRRPRRSLADLAALLAAAAVLVVAVVVLRGGGDGDGGEPPQAASAVHDPATIVPGRSIGAVKLGMSEGDVVKALGMPPAQREWTSRGKTGTTATYTVHHAPFRVAYYDGKVVLVSTRSDYYKTAGGIGTAVRPPDAGKADTRKEALRTGELVQVGKDRYSWRGFLFDGTSGYCASGNGGATVLRLLGAYPPDVRVVANDFVQDQIALTFDVEAGQCTSTL